MVHGSGAVFADENRMELSFLTNRRSTATCEHVHQVSFEIAGMSRSVCENCGKVSVRYIENHFSPERIYEVESMLSSLHASNED